MKKGALLSLISALFFLQGFAQIVDPFSIRYQNQQKGGIVMLSNVSVSCTNCNTTIAQVPPSGNGVNNNFTMSYVDVDNNASTFMSSSDSLNLSSCSEVLWAGLYWTARVGTGGSVNTTTNYNQRNQVKLKVGNGTYQTLTADELLDNSTGHQTYHCYKNITSVVQSNGIKARYTVADLVTRTGTSAVYGGWTIVVVYKNVYESMRNLTVFDGLANVSTGNNVIIPISGFVTPLAGPVNFELGVVSHDGDRGDVGDQLLFNGAGTYVNVSDALHNSNDIFNSTIANNAVLTPFRNPSLNNTLGHDASVFKPANTSLNYIGNNATSANIQITTGAETILTSVVTSVIDVFEPDLRATVYISDINGGQVNPGDQLEYTVVGKNIGSDISVGTFITDTLDPRTVYVPNSISISYGQNMGAKTDAFSDDQAEYDPVNKVIIARIGSGANSTTGGTVANSPTGADSTVLKFRVTVINDCLMFQCDQTLEHKAYIFGTGHISGNQYNNSGLSDLYDANGCPTIASNTLSINVAGCPAPTVTSNSPVCVGGTIQLSVPFSASAHYAWTGPNGFTSTVYNPAISNVTLANQGTYSVTITFDGLDCALNASATVIVNPKPVIQQNSLTNVSCFGGNTGAVSISASGNGAFTYAWSNGNNTPNPTGLTAGNYTVTVTDANTCTATQTFTITQNPQITGTVSATTAFHGFNISCFGGSDGAATVSVTGGTPSYTYLWNNGSTTISASNLPVGTASVTVTDNLGCTRVLSAALTQPTQLQTTTSPTNVACFGDNTGSISSVTAGGVAPYVYSWAGASSLNNLPVGTYNLTVTDQNGCTTQNTMTITGPAAALSLSSALTQVLCFGASAGMIDLTPAGGTFPYSYAWSNGATSQDLSNIPAGNYSVVVTDAHGCQATQSFTVTQPAAAISATSAITSVLCFGTNTGAIDVTPAGGTGTYTYTWSSGETTQDLTGKPAGNYTLTITDQNSCTFTLNNLNISQPAAALQTSLQPVDASCFGESSGSVSQTTTGGTIPYTYAWNSGETTQNLISIPQGTYTANVTDANGCTASATAAVNQPLAGIQLSETHLDVLCYNETTGSIDVATSGGTMPYTFSWSNGQTTEDLTSVASGNYTLTVTDQLGCTQTVTASVSQPAQPLTATETHTDALCIGGQQGTIDLSVSGGTAPYIYLWNNTSTNPDQIDLLAGTYTVQVTDAHNCQASISVEIFDPSNTTVLSETHTDVACFNQSTAAIDLHVTGGVAPHTYVWTNGETTQDIASLPAGTYAVNVLDFNSCGEFISVVITEPATAVTASVVHTDVLCNGFNTGSMEVTASGGVAPYTYAWSNGETTALISNLVQGTYTATVTDDNGCDFSISETIDQPDQIVIAETIADVACFGNNTGNIQIAVSGGVSAYNFSWSNGSANQSVNALIAGSYTITVTDQNNCTEQETYTIAQPAAPLSTSDMISTVSCFGASDGAIDFSVTGGTLPYTFAWSNGQTSEDLSGLTAGTYSVTVTDHNGCTIAASLHVTQPAAPLSIVSSQVNVLCHEEQTGSINITVSGGTAPYQYNWSNGSSSEDLAALADGTYSVSVEDDRGCTATQSFQVTQPAAPLSATETHADVNCYGASTASINTTFTGGTMPYAFAWNSGQTTEDLNSVPAGTYSVQVTDFNGCPYALTGIIITQPAAPLSDTYSSTPVACYGASTGSVTVTIAGGTSPYNYSWSTGGTSSQISSQPAGNYTLAVTDDKGCVLNHIYTITQPAAPLVVSMSMNPVICHGESNGNATAAVTGGTSPYTYAWSTGSTNASAINLSAGNYSVTVTDFNNCQATGSIAVTQPAALAIQLSAVDVLCYGQSTGSAAVAAIGGQGTYTYTWGNGASTPTISNLPAGTYGITVTDANNCSYTSSIAVNQPSASLDFTFTKTDNLCFGGTSGSASVAISGGTAPYTNSWSNSSTSLTISNLSAGFYTFHTTDAHNCVLSESVMIAQPSQISITDSVRTQVSCNGFADGAIDFTAAGGTPAYSYLWNTGATTEDISGLTAGNYAVLITDANSCQRTFGFDITQPAILQAAYTTVQPSCFGYTDGTIFSTVSGGTMPYAYAWSNGATTADNTNAAAGNHDLTITDNNGCVLVLNTVLTQPAQIQVSFDANKLVGCDPLKARLTNTSDEQFQSSWDFGDGTTGNGSQIEHIFSGEGCYDINLEVTDANGCSNNVTYSDFICVLETPVASIGVSNLDLGVYDPETTITNLSTHADSYSWNLGGTNDYDYFEPGAHTFPAYNADQFLVTLIAYNENGCVDSTTVLIHFDNDLIMYVPNTFTPNGDEFNQVFMPVFPTPPAVYNLKIYNRWGEMIFESSDTNIGWDGTYNGVLVQDGVYTWDIFVNTFDAHLYKKQGFVSVLK